MCDTRKFRIGYALRPDTSLSFIKQSLLDHSLSQGIQLVQIHTTEPLIQQGPFDAIIHKLYGQEWNLQLHHFSSQNPNVVIIDSPPAVEKLHNRLSMLEAVGHMPENTVSIPKQVLIDDSKLLSDDLVDELKFPVIAKPLLANSSSKSHMMSLVFNKNGLKELNAPVLLQEFVNHGGVLFKVYVAGKYVKCVRRNSLPDISEEEEGKSGNLISFSQISSTNCDIEKEMPSSSFVEEVGQGLREALKLNLFNFDMIKDCSGNHYVIDINYFPGYEKLPDYESLLTDFFRDIMKDNNPSSCQNCNLSDDGKCLVH